MPDGTIGSTGTEYVETQYFHLPEPLELESGEVLPQVTLAYETYGVLNRDRDNGILIVHALTGDAHAAGYQSPRDKKPGWWDSLIGPGKGIDTNRYFVICSNVLGGCQGSTGPLSVNPATKRPYGIDFPIITIGDMVKAQGYLVAHLGIDKLHGVVGGSMGGMQVLHWVTAYPEKVANGIVLASAPYHTAQQIAFNEVGRRAITADPNWRGGDYYGQSGPQAGLSVARMVGHITYLSEQGMQTKFGRRERKTGAEKFAPSFEVENYLSYQGNSFVNRFDANSYLYITKAVDTFNVADIAGGMDKALARVQARMLVIAFSSDWLYPPHQSREIVASLRRGGREVTYCEIESDYGHDAFLLPNERVSSLVEGFLATGCNQTGRRPLAV